MAFFNLREFYDYVENGKAGSELTKRIDEAVVRSRKNSIWRSQYMKEKIVLQDAREEGFEEGIEQNIISMICKKLIKGKDAITIANEIEEPVEKVSKICDIASRYLPNYDVRKIMEELR